MSEMTLFANKKIILSFSYFLLYSLEYPLPFSPMKIRNEAHKKRVSIRLKRVEGQIRGVIDMIETEDSLLEIIQQLSAIRSAIGSALNEEILCGIEKMLEKNENLTEKDYEEIRKFMKVAR